MTINREPKIGESIYIPSELYLDHGRDDIEGGLTKIVAIEKDLSGRWWIELSLCPGEKYNWEILLTRQAELESRFGQNVANLKPDNRNRFN